VANVSISLPEAPRGARAPSRLLTLGTMVLGWALVRLVAGGGRPSESGGQGIATPGQGEQVKTRRDEQQHAQRNSAQEAGRGRDASTPTDIPALGWKDILWRVYEAFSKDRVMSVAAGVTFYGLLALFPAIAALVSIYGLFADPATIQDHLTVLSGVLPGGALEIVREQVTRIASQGGGTLGLNFVLSLAISLWSANAGMKSVFDALNIVYDEDEKRSFVGLNLRSRCQTGTT
jgi:membrane protein